MTASISHEGGQYFLRRARHFARRELAARDGALPVSVSMLAHFLLYLGGVRAAHIALWEEARREALLPRVIKREDVTPEDAAEWAAVSRRSIAKQLLVCMALIGNGEQRARIAALSEEMGVINFEPREAEQLRFPGPSRLSHKITEAAS